MLFRLEVENFGSIREPQIIDIRTQKGAAGDSEHLAPIGRGQTELAPKVVALFGANASGKSTVLRALSFVCWFIRDSFSLTPVQFMPFTRFLDAEKQDAPMRIEVWLNGPSEIDNLADVEQAQCKYSYEVVFGGKHTEPQFVLSETLKYWPLTTNRPIVLVRRDTNGKIKGNKVFGLAGYLPTLQKILRRNASIISTLAQLQHPLSTQIWRATQNVHSNILSQKEDLNDDYVLKLFRGDTQMLQALNAALQRIDLGINQIHLAQSTDGPVAVCNHEGLNQPLLFALESHGTKQFVRVFPFLYKALMGGGIAIVDELDLAIHPLVLPEILRWFQDSRKNTTSAQLWLTAQNASLLDALAKEEIFFCEKDNAGRTEVYGLKDIQAVRKEDNFYRKYLGGVYGAVPQVG